MKRDCGDATDSDRGGLFPDFQVPPAHLIAGSDFVFVVNRFTSSMALLRFSQRLLPVGRLQMQFAQHLWRPASSAAQLIQQGGKVEAGVSETLPVPDPRPRRIAAVHAPLVAVPVQDPGNAQVALVESGSEPSLVPGVLGSDVVRRTVPVTLAPNKLTPQCPVRERLQLCFDQQLERRLKCLKRSLGRQQLPKPTHMSGFGMRPMKLPAHVDDLELSSLELLTCLDRFLGPEFEDRDRALLELVAEVTSIREWVL